MDTKKRDTIELRSGFSKLPISVSIGVYDDEHIKKQTILVTLSIAYSTARIRLLDAEDKFICVFDYAHAAELIRELSVSRHFEVIEHLALKILEAVRTHFPDSQTVTILVEKPDAIPGSEGSFCEIVSEP